MWVVASADAQSITTNLIFISRAVPLSIVAKVKLMMRWSGTPDEKSFCYRICRGGPKDSGPKVGAYAREGSQGWPGVASASDDRSEDVSLNAPMLREGCHVRSEAAQARFKKRSKEDLIGGATSYLDECAYHFSLMTNSPSCIYRDAFHSVLGNNWMQLRISECATWLQVSVTHDYGANAAASFLP